MGGRGDRRGSATVLILRVFFLVTPVSLVAITASFVAPAPASSAVAAFFATVAVRPLHFQHSCCPQVHPAALQLPLPVRIQRLLPHYNSYGILMDLRVRALQVMVGDSSIAGVAHQREIMG